MATKIGFLRHTNGLTTAWSNGEDIRFKCKNIVEKCITDKTLGFDKYHLNKSKQYQMSNIDINWKKNCVEHKHKKVVWITEASDIEYDEEVNSVRTSVEESIKEWKEKRGLK